MLDKYQMETVNFTDGAALVLAGPGSGKTTCILARIISLVKERNIPAERILVITFTKACGSSFLYDVFVFVFLETEEGCGQYR